MREIHISCARSTSHARDPHRCWDRYADTVCLRGASRPVGGDPRGTLAEEECQLLELSPDEVRIVTHEVFEPLQPILAVYLSSTAKGLR